jgi:hypothetical protein
MVVDHRIRSSSHRGSGPRPLDVCSLNVRRLYCFQHRDVRSVICSSRARPRRGHESAWIMRTNLRVDEPRLGPSSRDTGSYRAPPQEGLSCGTARASYGSSPLHRRLCRSLLMTHPSSAFGTFCSEEGRRPSIKRARQSSAPRPAKRGEGAEGG